MSHAERPFEDQDDDLDEIRPGDADYDLSEEHGYTWEPHRTNWPPRWLIVAVTAAVIAALVVPSLIIILDRY
jgi:hypothetical protein